MAHSVGVSVDLSKREKRIRRIKKGAIGAIYMNHFRILFCATRKIEENFGNKSMERGKSFVSSRVFKVPFVLVSASYIAFIEVWKSGQSPLKGRWIYATLCVRVKSAFKENLPLS